MLENLNRNLRRNILEQFRQETINYRERKKYEKLKKIQEEKDYLLKQEQLYNNDIELINKERYKKKEQEFNEYNLMLSKLNSKTPAFRLKKKFNNKAIAKRPIIKFNINEIEKNRSLKKRERDIILRRDIIGEYLTDEDNTEQLLKDMRKEKEKSQRYYKEISDLQYLEYQKNNMKKFGTIDPLIVKRAKRKMLTEDPFINKIKFDLWKSNLNNNPILNPENNVHYNKYLFKENIDCDKYNYNQMVKNETNKNYNSLNTDCNYRRIKLIKNNKSNNGFMNTPTNKSNLNLFNSSVNSGYEMELKKKFFNINNECYRINNNNNNYKKNINYNDYSYEPKINKRRVLRQAISSSFLH